MVDRDVVEEFLDGKMMEAHLESCGSGKKYNHCCGRECVAGRI